MLVSEAFGAFLLDRALGNGSAKTRRNYLSCQKSVLICLGDIPIEVLTLEHVQRWQAYLNQSGHQQSTIKANLCQLRCVLKFLKRRGMNVLDYRDIELPSIKRREHVVLDYSEVQQMIDATDNPRDKAIIACLFSTGCRISELLNLNCEDIIGNQAIVTGKGSKQRTVFFDEKALKYLEEYLETRSDNLPPLFISGQYRRITVTRVEQIIHVLTAGAGIDKIVTPHVFRHSTITDYIQNGAPMPMVQKIAGHASIQTTIDIYTHVSNPVIKETFTKYHTK